MRATSHTSTPIATITALPGRSARAAGVTGGGVAGRRRERGESFPPLGEEVALVDGVIDEAPGKERVVRIGAMDEAVGIDPLPAPAERLEGRPPRLRARVQPGEDCRRPPIATRKERLQVRLPRTLRLHRHGGNCPPRPAPGGEALLLRRPPLPPPPP